MHGNDLREARAPMKALHPEGWQSQSFAQGMQASGTYIFVSGQLGVNPNGDLVAPDMATQTTQALKNIIQVVSEGGGSATSIATLTWYVTNIDLYKRSAAEIGQSFVALFEGHRPAITMIEVNALFETAAFVEISAIAVV